MAVKALQTITLYKAIDVASLTLYFKTVNAGSAAPAKPTTATPTGWSTSEPTFNLSKDLYATLKTTYTDDTFMYSNPQKYSSYEAAKQAYNLADSANTLATDAYDLAENNVIEYFGGKTGSVGIWGESLFMEDANGTYQNICTASNGTVTTSNKVDTQTKKANRNGFKVNGTIYYSKTSYNASTNISGQNDVFTSHGIFDSRYSLNTKRAANNLVPYKPVYLVGTIDYDSDDANGLFYLDTTTVNNIETWWTQTPNTAGKVYILIGACYDCDSSNCRINLYEHNKWYKYDSKWGLVEMQIADNRDNRESYHSLSAEVATVKNTGNSLQYIVASLKSGDYAYDQATGNFVSGTTYYEYVADEIKYKPLTWDSTTSKYIDQYGNEYEIGDPIPTNICLRGKFIDGFEQVAEGYDNFKKTFIEQTDEEITSWFANKMIDGKSLEGNINDLKTQITSAKALLDAYDAYIRQSLDVDPVPTITTDTKYLTTKKYFTLNSQSGEYELLIEGTDYDINDDITGTVYESLHYGDAYIELGALSNTTKIRIYPSEVVFLTAGNRSAYLSNNNLYISESTIIEKEKIGHWLTYEDEQHNLNTKWVND